MGVQGFQPGNKMALGVGKGPQHRRPITQQLIASLHEVDEGTSKARVRRMVDKLIDLAIEGDVTAIKEVIDRVEGKAVQAVQMSGPGGGPVVTISANMTPAEAAALYAGTLGGEEENVVIEHEEPLQIEDKSAGEEAA
jgi:hypothetical protein